MKGNRIGKTSLSNTNPELVKEWDYDRNAPLTPDDVTAGSNRKVWWIGNCGHSWSAVISSRSLGRKCPYCSGRLVLPGFNDLATTYPNLLKEWDYEKNIQITPDMISAGSHQKVWWKCDKDHKWESAINNRTINGHGCPYCTHQKVLPGYNDLLSQNPAIAEEWDAIRNGSLKPDSVNCGSEKKVWWRCKKGHEWKASISNRTGVNSCGCPVCSGKKVLPGYNDLATLNPQLSKEWNLEKNDISPSQVSGFSAKKVWWECSKGHEWKASIANRAKGRGCPYCSGRKVLVGFNDLATVNPNIAEEWNYEKNYSLKPTDFTYGSNQKVWWKCIRGHEWEAVISNRVLGTGCPYCASNGSSMPEQGVAYYLSKLYTIEQRKKISGVEIDVYIPKFHIGIEYDGLFFHSSAESIMREKYKNSVLEKQGIFVIHIKEGDVFSVSDNRIDYVPDRMGANYVGMIETLMKLLEKRTGITNDMDINPNRDTISIREHFSLVSAENSIEKMEIAKEWDYEKNGKLTPDMFSAGSRQQVWWIGECGHNWKASISNRIKGNKCPYCAGQKVLVGFNDLSSLFPTISDEWNYSKNVNASPDQYTAYSGKTVWWKCSKGHEWKASIDSRTNRGNGCPYCSGRRTLSGFNDISTTNPELLEEWNYERNSINPKDFSIGSGISVWWKCSKGHEWKAKIAYRGYGTGCPYCAGQKVMTGYNDLATTNPELIKEWDCEKNVDLDPKNVTAGTTRKAWWKCPVCGNNWQASINSRSNGCGCPICSAKLGAQKVTKTRILAKGSLSETHPELLKEWNYEKNSDIFPNSVLAGSDAKVWWVCEKGHEWKAVIHSRTGKAKHGCPVCNHKLGGEKCMKRVLNIDTGETFRSVKQAAESHNLSSASIVHACKGLSKTAGGYHWKYN